MPENWEPIVHQMLDEHREKIDSEAELRDIRSMLRLMRENIERGLYEGKEYQYWQKIDMLNRVPESYTSGQSSNGPVYPHWPTRGELTTGRNISSCLCFSACASHNQPASVSIHSTHTWVASASHLAHLMGGGRLRVRM